MLSQRNIATVQILFLQLRVEKNLRHAPMLYEKEPRENKRSIREQSPRSDQRLPIPLKRVKLQIIFDRARQSYSGLHLGNPDRRAQWNFPCCKSNIARRLTAGRRNSRVRLKARYRGNSRRPEIWEVVDRSEF